MNNKRNNKIDEIQANEYSFPYHYIPNNNTTPFFAKSWKFSPSYIASINITKNWLLSIEKNIHKHIDFGCGDGGFIYNLSKTFDDMFFYGIDYDKKAVSWAKNFNNKTNVNFSNEDIKSVREKFDSGSLIEVIEHIPPLECKNFIENVSKSLKKGAELIVTVPSIEKPVGIKHYRHFNHEILIELFSENFNVKEKFYFEKKNILSKFLMKIVFGKNHYFESKFISKRIIKIYSKKHALINKCGRVCVIFEKL